MANLASISYAVEGPQKDLEKIFGAICLAVNGTHSHWEEWQTCVNLGFTEKELEGKRLGGEISEEPSLDKGVLRFWAEERWGLQDFEKILRQKFPDIKVYWVVEESGCEVYCTNDKGGKYFPERYWVDTAQDDIYQSEYFQTEEGMYKWLSEITNGKVKSEKDVKKFNSDHEAAGDDYENFIYIHEFEIDEEE